MNNTPTNQDKATARPWRFSHLHLRITDANMNEIADLDIEGDFTTRLADGDLIIKAVNEHAALKAVAEAAKDFQRMHNDQVFICGQDDNEMVENNLKNLNTALANLNALRNTKE